MFEYQKGHPKVPLKITAGEHLTTGPLASITTTPRANPLSRVEEGHMTTA